MQQFNSKRLRQLSYDNDQDDHDLPRVDQSNYKGCHWVKLFYNLCKIEDKFYDHLFINQEARYYTIINYLNFDNLPIYHYDRRDFNGAMKALQDYLFKVYPLEKLSIENMLSTFKQSQTYCKVQFSKISISDLNVQEAITEFKLLQQATVDLFQRLQNCLLELLKESGLLEEKEELTVYTTWQNNSLKSFENLLESNPNKDLLKKSHKAALKLFKEAIKDAESRLQSSQRRVKMYNVKKFCNKDNEGRGHMECFPCSHLEFAELRIIPDNQGTQVNKNPLSVSRCRFVYVYIRNEAKFEGVLFLTTSHYGWDFLPELILDKILSENPFNKRQKDIKSLDWNKKHEIVKCKFFDEIYRLQQRVIFHCNRMESNEGLFRFVNLGAVTFDNRNFTLNLDTDNCNLECLFNQ